jgi:hypothetical protein
LQYQDTKPKATKEKKLPTLHDFIPGLRERERERSFVSPRAVHPLSLPNKQKKQKEYTHIHTYIRVIG